MDLRQARRGYSLHCRHLPCGIGSTHGAERAVRTYDDPHLGRLPHLCRSCAFKRFQRHCERGELKLEGIRRITMLNTTKAARMLIDGQEVEGNGPLLELIDPARAEVFATAHSA